MTSSLKLFLILYYIKQTDSKLPCVYSVIDHGGRQNVVRTSVIHSATPYVPLFCSYHVLTSCAIYYWTDARQLGIHLLNIYTYIYIYYYYYHLYYFEFALFCSKGRGQNNTISLGRKCIQGEAILDPYQQSLQNDAHCWRSIYIQGPSSAYNKPRRKWMFKYALRKGFY